MIYSRSAVFNKNNKQKIKWNENKLSETHPEHKRVRVLGECACTDLSQTNWCILLRALLLYLHGEKDFHLRLAPQAVFKMILREN